METVWTDFGNQRSTSEQTKYLFIIFIIIIGGWVIYYEKIYYKNES